jgi:tetratricopeptide (TPR) repeat protein
MPWNIHVQRALRVAALSLVGSRGLIAQAPCPAGAAATVRAGWAAYRADSLDRAAERFTRVLHACPGNRDAEVGLGFTLLRLDRAAEADSLFLSVLSATPANADAWEGRTRAAFRKGDTTAMLAAGRRALALTPANQELRALLDRVAPDWDRAAAGPRRRPTTLQLPARTRGRRFEVLADGRWRPFYVRGVNLSAALPGHYPSEFPADSARYAGWLDTLAGMHANALRVYTVFPPAFYRALRAFNLRHPRQALWLIHGVWTELPPGDDFAEPGWQVEFRTEMRRVVDLVHGAATIPRRRGHAGGRYDADVSPWTLAYIIGREWEPYAVQAWDRREGSDGSYAGRFLSVEHAPAMDLWLARQCDYMLAYEVDSYNGLRPIAYTNWPTLDPLTHPTEPTAAEEALRRQRAGRLAEGKALELENDAVALDANLVRPTPANPAGWFASYHA